MDDPSEDQEAQFLLETDKCSTQSKPTRWPLHAVLYLLVLLFTNFLTALLTSRPCAKRSSVDANHISGSSDRPLYEDLDRTSFHAVNFSGFSLGHSKYTAPASSEVDEAWRALGVEYRAFLVPIDQALAFGISDNHVVVPGDAPGAEGEPGYVADMDGIHQLHCLNLLRKALFFNHAYYSSPEHTGAQQGEFREFGDPSRIVRGHIAHCLDALRERIMCAADSEVLPYYWRKTEGFTRPDFAVSRRCRDFESLRAWAEKHQLEYWGGSYKLTTPEDAYLAPDPFDFLDT